jgi:hypothetical protein
MTYGLTSPPTGHIEREGTFLPPNPFGSERRRYGRRLVLVPRVLFSQNAVIEIQGLGRVPVMVRDVGLEGVRFTACVQVEVGSEFVLNVEVVGRSVEMPCRVVYVMLTGEAVGERLFMHGCHFVGLSPSDSQAIAAFAWM